MISIIIPTYNRAHFIGQTLDSVLAQTYENWECIVVDDGSTDYTDELLAFYTEKDARIRYYDRPKNRPKGANACRNYGFELSKGEYIQWFDSDDLMLNFFLKIKIDSFENSLVLVIFSGYYTNEILGEEKKISLDENIDLYEDYVAWKHHILTPSVMFRKTFLDDKNLFSLKITRGQEAEFYSRIFFLLPKKSFLIKNEFAFLYRQHSTSITMMDRKYIRINKSSVTSIFLDNLKRSIILKNQNLINILNKKLVNMFFRSLENNHKENCLMILKNIFILSYPRYRRFNRNFLASGVFLLMLGRGSHKVEKILKRQSDLDYGSF